MPPRKKKNEIDRMALLAKKLGMNIDNIMAEVPITEVGAEAIIRKDIEAESVLFYIEAKGKGFKEQTCKRCGGLFLHTYVGVNYCSEECRAYALAQVGIIWNFHRRRDSERWNSKGKGYVPKIIGVTATAALIEAGHHEIDEEEYEPEVPYDPNFKLADHYEHPVDEQEIIEAEETLNKLKANGAH